MASAPSTPADSSTITTLPRKRRRIDDDANENALRSVKRAIGRKECSVCAEDVARNQFPKVPHATTVATEQHASNVCFKCWRQHLQAEVESKEAESLACPQCSKALDQSEVKKLASSFTYREYLDKAAKKCMQDEEEFHACPNAACSWGAFFAKDDGNVFICQECNARYCMSCNVPFHEGQTCEQYVSSQRRAEEEDASIAAVARISRPCPHCGISIDKYTGCDHVTCQRCRHEFCWECFRPYRGARGIFRAGNTAHTVNCRYYPNNLPNLRLAEVEEESEESEEDE
ncbi:hypothetical protein WHR41_03394 [Cladosporium halotolerans]|uniref:RBR-type E3 ubiquitin transferase n=1 Tax=Cladosporium halotolerans TaxID=1052096 RepID=A0AB34KXI9_9PEZI